MSAADSTAAWCFLFSFHSQLSLRLLYVCVFAFMHLLFTENYFTLLIVSPSWSPFTQCHTHKWAYRHFSMCSKVSILLQLALICKETLSPLSYTFFSAPKTAHHRGSSRSSLHIDFSPKQPFQLSMDWFVDAFSFFFFCSQPSSNSRRGGQSEFGSRTWIGSMFGPVGLGHGKMKLMP